MNNSVVCFVLSQNKNMPLMDMQKSSNAVALVESFLGEFKPDEEESPSEPLDNKSNIKMVVENQVGDSQTSKEEVLSNFSKISKTLENEVSNKMKANQLNTSDVNISVNKYDDALKETVEKCVIHEKQLLPPSPPPPQPVKRKVKGFISF